MHKATKRKRGKIGLFVSFNFFHDVYRKFHEVDEESEEEFENGLCRIDGSNSDTGEIDDDIFPELTFFESLNPRESVREIDLFV